MKKLLAHRLTLVLEILVTLAVCGVLVLFSFRQLHREALYFNSSVNRDYTYIMDGYTTAFDILCLHLDDKIRENPSLEEMQTWLYGQASTFRKAVGYNIFDDFYFTYKGGFVHSWPHGDYSQYVPSSRGWYQAAQKADGASVVIPPYKSFIGTTVITSIAKKYADDIYVGMDLKSQSLSNLLLERGFTNHSSRWLLLANAKGDVISANRPQLLKHNLFKNDDLITSSFSEALRSAQLRQLYPASATIAGSSMLVYAFPNDNGNLVCFLVPVADYFQEHLAPILFLALLLIVLEVAINIISRRRLLEESVVANTKDDFLSRMSHDIRTPLNGVIGMTQLAREANSSPVVGDYLRKIDISSHYLLGLVNDILDLSKINAGKMELHPEPYKETDFLQYLDSIILPMCAAKHQHFTAENYHWKHDVLVDKLKYNQIYFNLLSNAVKYTPEGGHIHMLTRNVRYEDGYMVFDSIISDDGIGMSREFQDKMFSPFEQENTSRDGRQQGSGLGLSIVKKLVDLFGGTIEVESSPGKGTTFILHLRLPLAPDTLPAPDQTAPLDETFFRGQTFLVAEDNAINSEIILRLLAKKGIKTLLAVNGQEAVAMFDANLEKIDAVLMDIQMPVMNGKEATRMIRALPDPKAQQVPIIALTANAYDEDVKSCLEAGMDAHVAKPIEPDKLFATLATVLNQKKQ